MYEINFPFLKNAVNMDHHVVGALLLGVFLWDRKQKGTTSGCLLLGSFTEENGFLLQI